MLKPAGMTRSQANLFLESACLLWLLAFALEAAHAQPATNPARPFPPPMNTDLQLSTSSANNNHEHITVLGKYPAFRKAALPIYGENRAPWETDKAIRDTMTGADTAPFGNAYNLGSPLGSDERSNETGGQFIAPRHN